MSFLFLSYQFGSSRNVSHEMISEMPYYSKYDRKWLKILDRNFMCSLIGWVLVASDAIAPANHVLTGPWIVSERSSWRAPGPTGRS